MMNYSVLIIEDSRSQSLYLKLLLERAGYQVSLARDGAEGWHMACDIHPHLIVLDINLPGVDGFRVLSLLKHAASTQSIPVVMITSLDRMTDLDQALALGADGYLIKEDCIFHKEGPASLLETLRECIAKYYPKELLKQEPPKTLDGDIPIMPDNELSDCPSDSPSTQSPDSPSTQSPDNPPNESDSPDNPDSPDSPHGPKSSRNEGV
jgi:CheY-like chemotaxis protein